MSNYDEIICGHLCLDIIPLFSDTGLRKIEKLMRPGKRVSIQNARFGTSYPVSNTGNADGGTQNTLRNLRAGTNARRQK